ncbi:hypothetical protein CG719_22790 [Streptomyces sp. CB01373]|nr:hypothetical protein CG719_22790 [Streptomyces sp. CB01373]
MVIIAQPVGRFRRFHIGSRVEEDQKSSALEDIAQFPLVAGLNASLVHEHLQRRPVEILAPTPKRRRSAPSWV